MCFDNWNVFWNVVKNVIIILKYLWKFLRKWDNGVKLNESKNNR